MTGTRLRADRRDEGGAILILSAVAMVIAIISAALAIDLGFVANDVRVDQKVADLAALDAVRVLPSDPTTAAEESALRNGFVAPGDRIEVKWGPSRTGPWSSDAADLTAATAVQVTAFSEHENLFPFVGEVNEASRKAVAMVEDKAQFSVGSNLAELDTNDSVALNRLMNGLLGTDPPSAASLSLVGYRGLAAGSVSLADLVAADPSLGTPDDLLNGSVTVKRLAQATVTALNNKGDAASLNAATLLGTFASNIKSTLTFSLADILSIEQPADPGSVAAETQFSVFDLITGAGQAAVSNGTGFITIDNMTVSVAGLADADLKLTIIEPPKISAFGPALYNTSTGTWATTAHTAQVKVELNSHIVVPGTCGLLATCVDLRMPLVVSAAKATGSLTDIRCPSGSTTKEADVNVVTTGANATADNILAVKLLGIPLSLPPIISTNVAMAGGTTTPDMTFSGPPFPTPIQSTAATGAGLTTATTSQLTVLGLNLGTVLGLLNPVTSAIDEEILEPLFNALGLSVGGADVRALRIECGVPGLVS